MMYMAIEWYCISSVLETDSTSVPSSWRVSYCQETAMNTREMLFLHILWEAMLHVHVCTIIPHGCIYRCKNH